MRHLLSLSLLVGLGFSASAAPVKIGAVCADRGPLVPLDGPTWKGAQAAAAVANRSGQQVELVRIGFDSTPASAAAAVRAALQKDPTIAGFVGVSDSNVALAAGREAVRAGKVFVTSGATSPLLPSQLGKRFFLACFGDNVQAAAGAEWLLQRGARRACVLYDTDKIYTRLLRRYFESAFAQGGGKIAETIAFRAGDPVGIPENLGACDAVYLAAETADDAEAVIRKFRAAGFKGPIVGGDGYDNPSLWSGNPLAEKVYFTTHAYPANGAGAASAATQAAFRGAYAGDPDAFGGLGFDALRVLLAANPAQSDGLAKRLQNGAPYAGVTGPIAYRGGSRVPAKPVALIDASRPRQPAAQITPSFVPKP